MIRRVALMIVLVGGLFSASPVLAGGGSYGGVAYRPDGWVRFHSYHYQGGKLVDPSAWHGDDVYNTTAVNQVAKRHNVAGEPLDGNYDVFQVTIQNDGATDRFRVGATGNGNWVVRYYRGKTNITTAVVGGTFMTRSLASGESLVLRVKVWIGDVDTSVARLLTISSVGNPSQKDAVRIKDSFSGCGC